MNPNEINTAVEALVSKGGYSCKYEGTDNYGVVKSVYLKKIVQMTDDQLYDECKDIIWLSAYASNNSRSDYHWKCDACYEECQRRNKSEIYNRAHTSASSN